MCGNGLSVYIHIYGKFVTPQTAYFPRTDNDIAMRLVGWKLPKGMGQSSTTASHNEIKMCQVLAMKISLFLLNDINQCWGGVTVSKCSKYQSEDVFWQFYPGDTLKYTRIFTA